MNLNELNMNTNEYKYGLNKCKMIVIVIITFVEYSDQISLWVSTTLRKSWQSFM